MPTLAPISLPNSIASIGGSNNIGSVDNGPSIPIQGSAVLGASTAPPTVPVTPTTPVTPTAPSSSSLFAAAMPSILGNYLTEAGTATDTAANTQNMNILDYLDTAKANQVALNNQSVQNEESQLQGDKSVTDMVGQGIDSGGVTLANDNASDSSAGDALARAYGILGRTDMTQVGNQAALANNTVNNEQTADTVANAAKERDFGLNKTNVVNGIVQTLQAQLASLNTSAAYAGATPVDIAKQTATLKANAMAQLSQYDGELSSGISSIAPASTAATDASATNLLESGTAPSTAYSYSPIAPVGQATGPSPSPLPIYTAAPPASTKQTATV